MFWIILAIMGYIIIGCGVYRIACANDFFDEFAGYKMYEFPMATFMFSVLWLIAIPLSLIMALFGWIAEEIECAGYAYREVALQRRYARERAKREGGENK